MFKWLGKLLLGILILIVVAGLSVTGVLFYQGARKPQTDGEYVALGSSFAAGLSLGPRVPGSPLVCRRSINGYPQQLARLLNISLVDMTCSGATIKHVLHGGQIFLGPQIDAIGPATRLVTLTAGGNDISYVGDLTMMAFKRQGGIVGLNADLLWKGPKPIQARNFAQLESDMTATLREIARRAPNAKIVLVTYPVILPPSGTCAQAGISEEDAALMHEVGSRFAEVQRAAALAAGALVVDMAEFSAGHDACSREPWVNGAAPVHGVLFHPTLAGAEATARQIQLLLDTHR